MRAIAKIGVVILAAAAIAVPAGAASAATTTAIPFRNFALPVTATALTQITNDPDSGNGTPALWNDEDITRVVTVTRGSQVPASDCGLVSGACWSYTMSLSDSGTFATRPGAGTPNQACAGCAGEKIRSKVTGSLNGTYTVTFDASSGTPDATLVKTTHDDHGVKALPPYSTTTWGEQFFPAGTAFSNPVGGAYSWEYTVLLSFPRQQWTDSSTNGDGNAPGDGNITG